MEVCHDKKADDTGDDAEEFYAVIRGDAMSDVIADPLVFDDDEPADGENSDAEEEPTKIKIPIHRIILA